MFLYFYTQIPSPLFVFFLDVLGLVKMVKMKLKTNTSVCLVDVVNSHEGGGRGGGP